MEENFRKKIFTIWFGQSISHLTSAIFQMCIIWYLSLETGSASVLTTAVIVAYVPQAVISMFAGAFVDRFSKKKIIILSDLFIALTSLLLSFILVGGKLPIYAVYVVLAIRSVGTALHEPATQALTPLLVPEKYLTKYAGYSQVFSIVSTIISPAIALFLNDILPLNYIVLIDVFGAILAVMLIFPVKIRKQAPIKTKIHLINDFKDGILAIKNIKGLRTLLVISILYCFIYAPVGTLFPHITLNYFKGGTDFAAIVEIITAIGSLVGSFLLGFYGMKLNRFLGLCASMFFYGLGLLIIGILSPSEILIFVIVSFFMGVTIPVYHGVTTAVYQLKVPEGFLGRAFSITQATIDLAMPFGLIISGNFSDILGVNMLFFVLGVLCVILAIITLCLRNVKDVCN